MKRALDILVATVALIMLSPVFLILALVVRLRMGTPVLFRQRRPGVGGEPFELIKFRSMTDARNARGELLPDEQRLPATGRLLRSSSLDELPELWNVLRGDMSLVGPRPLLMEYLPLYSSRQARRHNVRPGLTGWAQINGRNSLSWEDKFELDVWYVENQSLCLDCRIILRTIWQVLARRGISAEGESTMPRFRGSQHSGSES